MITHPGIHPSAIVDPSAKLAEGVRVGAFSIIGPEVSIGAGTVIGSHVVIEGPTTIGRDNRIYNFAAIRRTRSSTASAPSWSSATTTTSANTPRSIAAQRTTIRSRASATTTS